MNNLSIAKPAEPCCEKCGQSLPQPAPLTIREKIDELTEILVKKETYLGKHTREVLTLVAEILGELENRPAVSYIFGSVPPIPSGPSPSIPFIPPTFPGVPIPQPNRPYIGDAPGYPYGTTCWNKNTTERTTPPVALNAVSDATGFAGTQGEL